MKKTLKNLLALLPKDTFTYTFTDSEGNELTDKKNVSALTDNIFIEHLEFDSRHIKPNTLFFALPGTHTTGNRFIAQAISNGAVCIIYEGCLSEEDKESISKAITKPVAFIHTESSRFAMSPISASFYDNPSEHMVIYGVTGTEGKSSTVSFIWQLLRLSGFKAGFISTVQYSLGGEAVSNPEHQTTPEAPIVQRELYEMLQNGCTHAVVESSSHGLSAKTNRLGDVHFDCAVFMNVTLEHLEFHKTLEQYKSDKANLFRSLDKWQHTKEITNLKKKDNTIEVPSFGIVNLEDPAALYFASCTKKKTIGFTTEGKAGKQAAEELKASPLPLIPEDMQYLSARNIASARYGLSFSIHRYEAHDSLGKENRVIHVKSSLPGAFNAYNIMASLLAVHGTTGTSLETLASYAENLTPVKGRMTVIDKGQPFEVIVDYAHTPSSFETIFPPVKQRCTGRMICLFGSGGERDTKKRPLQGEIAGRFCDTVILTDEDPRGEDSVELLEQIAGDRTKGARSTGKKDGENLFIIPDRPKAIRKAFSLAQANDIVLLLGKSHENSIIYKDYTMPYDEISEAEKALEEMGYTK